MANFILNTKVGSDLPANITYAMWAARRGAVKMESVGLRHSKIGSVRKLCAVELGLPHNASYDEVLTAIRTKMDELLEDMYGN